MNVEGVNISLHTFVSPELKSIIDEATEFIQTTPVYPLPPAHGFPGVGVYALYYFGDFSCYDYISRLNREECTQPIYIGKAVPAGWRTARKAKAEKSRALYGRLREHARSIDASENLRVMDFRCRFMILNGVEADLISAVESNIIRSKTPLWNTGVDGFGNHDPGKGRYNQAKSEWDVLHPGRMWATRLTGESSHLDAVIAKIDRLKNQLSLS